MLVHVIVDLAELVRDSAHLIFLLRHLEYAAGKDWRKSGVVEEKNGTALHSMANVQRCSRIPEYWVFL